MGRAFEGLAYEDALPLGMAPCDEPVGGPALAGYNAENLEVLVADASLDPRAPHRDKKADDDHQLAEELQRLEFKINVLIQLVSRLLRRDATLPAVRPIRLYADGIEWLERGTVPAEGSHAVLNLHVSHQIPQPLLLPGRVVGFRDDAQGRWVQFAFAGLTPAVHELLSRLIFRHHRRAIAGARGRVQA
ncbi:MAG: PilZ domain-containing protein [Steroidobacteraceae bacterium]|nr:PilZ domain-containing protein [Steroidobacteraceae bacterium]